MSIIIFLLVLGLLIFIHELGHFLAAKRSGVKVYEFALGFPPRIAKIERGGTEYSLNALPIGGYVRLQGENGEEEDMSEDEKRESFAHKGALTKTFILVAGVAMNMLLAWIMFSIAFMVGYPTVDQEIDEQYIIRDSVTVTYVAPDSPAEAAEILPGDEVTAIRDSEQSVAVDNAEAIGDFIRNTTDESVTLSLVRSGEERDVVVETTTDLESTEEAENNKVIGVASSDVSIVKYPPHLALIRGAQWTGSATTMTVDGLGALVTDLFQGEGDLSGVAGPIGIVGLVGDAYAVGFTYLLTFTAIISINLAVINLVPIPALDGGRILLVWLEVIKGSPINQRTQLIANGVSFALLILLMLVISINDVRNLFM